MLVPLKTLSELFYSSNDPMTIKYTYNSASLHGNQSINLCMTLIQCFLWKVFLKELANMTD